MSAPAKEAPAKDPEAVKSYPHASAEQLAENQKTYEENLVNLRALQRENLRLVREQHKQLEAPDDFARLTDEVRAWTRPAKAPLPRGKKGGARGRSKAKDEDVLEEESRGLMETPPYCLGTMRDYQVEGVNWMLSLFHEGHSCILADEMGLGKTYQSIAVLGYLKYQLGLPGPHLIVVPLTVSDNWMNEIQKWCPGLTSFKFHGYKDDKDELRHKLLTEGPNIDAIVTTYEFALAEKNTLTKMKFKYVLADEAHRLKSDTSQIAKAIRLVPCDYIILITGTPLQNNLHELWALLNLLVPALFDNAGAWDSWFDLAAGEANTDVISKLHQVLKPFMLRRLKEDVNTAIPPKKEVYVGCSLSPVQKDWYTKILAKEAAVLTPGGGYLKLMNVLMQLRKTCQHPYLFQGVEQPPYDAGEHLVENSGKLLMLDKLLSRLKKDGHRVLLFTQMSRVLDIIEDYLYYREYKYCRLDGSTSQVDRVEAMDDFNSPESDKFIFILTTRAGGLGINLNTADTVILFDSDWNPQSDLQAMDRAHRIGQKKPVTVYRLIVDNTIDERVYQRSLKKLYLDAAVIQQGHLAEKNKKASKEELLSMVRFGAKEMIKSSADKEGKGKLVITDEEVEAVLKRGEHKAKELEEQFKKEAGTSLASFKLGVDPGNMYEFEGVNYTEKATKQLFVMGINNSVTEMEVRTKLVSKGVTPMKVTLAPSMDKMAITFRGVRDATEAKKHLLHETLGDCDKITITYGEMEEVISKQDALQATLATEEESRPRRAAADICFNENVGFDMSVGRYEHHQKALRLPKKPNFPEHSFVDNKLLAAHWEKRCAWLTLEHQVKQKKKEDEIQQKIMKGFQGRVKEDKNLAIAIEGKSEADMLLHEELREEQGLTKEEVEAEAAMMAESFPKWKRNDTYQIIRLAGQVGTEPDKIAAKYTGDVDPAEIERYVKMFFAKGKEVFTDFDKMVKKVNRSIEEQKKHAEKIITLQKEVRNMMRGSTAKLQDLISEEGVKREKGTAMSEHIMVMDEDLRQERVGEGIRFLMTSIDGTDCFLDQKANKQGKVFWEDYEDKALMVLTFCVGWGEWEEVKKAIQRAPHLRMDYYLLSRTPAEMRQRVDLLLRKLRPASARVPRAPRKRKAEGEAGEAGEGAPAKRQRKKKEAITSDGEDGAIEEDEESSEEGEEE